MNQDSAPISTRYVLLAFFAIVLLCAVFFSLGFFLGRQEGNPANSPATEQVSPSSDIPPTVNPPAEPQSSKGSEEADEPPAPADASPPVSNANSTEPGSDETAAPEVPAGAPAAAKPPEKSAASSPRARQTSDEASAAPGASAAMTSVVKLPPGLTVQVAALSSQPDAANMVRVLQSRGYPALLLAPDQAHSKDIFYRVIVGPYKTRKQVDQVRSQLAEEGFKPFIRQ